MDDNMDDNLQNARDALAKVETFIVRLQDARAKGKAAQAPDSTAAQRSAFDSARWAVDQELPTIKQIAETFGPDLHDQITHDPLGYSSTIGTCQKLSDLIRSKLEGATQ